MFYRVSIKQHGDIKSSVLRSKNATILQARSASALSCLNMQKFQLSPQTHKCDHFAPFCGCNCKTSKICHQRTKFFTTGAG